MSNSNFSSQTDNPPAAPGAWTTSGDAPSGFSPQSGAVSGSDSDASYTEYSWSFGGTAPYHQNKFSATLTAELPLNGQVVGIAVSSDDTATVSIGGVGSASSSLFKPGSGCFFKEDGSKYSGSFPLTITYNTVGGPWSLSVRIRVATPKEPVPAEEECLCKYGACGMASSARSGSVDFSQPFGGTPYAAGFPKGTLRIYDRIPVAELFSGAGLRYVHPMTRRVREISGTTVVIEDALHTPYTYENGRPAGTAAWTDNQVRTLADGRVEETLPDRTRITYGADGTVEKIRSSEGVELTLSQLGIETVYDAAGSLAQVWSLTDGLMEIVPLSAKKFRLDWHKNSDVTAKNAETGRYGHAGTPIKTFTFGDVDDDGDCGVFELLEERAGSAEFSFHYSWRYDPEKKDWIFVRGNAEESDSETSEKEKTFSEDAAGNRFAQIREWKRSGSSAEATLVSTETYSYGETGEMLVGRSSGGIAEYSATRVSGGNGLGKIASETDRAGSETSYSYDDYGRALSVLKTKGFAGETEETFYSYAPVPAGEFADLRPRTAVHKIAGTVFRTETFSYDDDFENGREETRAVAANGETLTTRTLYYPANAGTVGAGRVKLEIRADGTATLHEYSAVSIPAAVGMSSNLGYTETVTEGVFADGEFSPVPGKSTRRIRTFDTRGNETRTEEHVHTGTEFELVSRENRTYSPAHKVIATTRSDGKTTSADYICTGAVWTIDENGVRTDNTFDSAKRLATSTRHGARGNVTTAYGYDEESRVISETETSGALTRTRSRTYNALGELVSETDALGNETRHSVSEDGLTETTTFPDGGTRITARNADGSLASETGTAVVPKYYSYAFDAATALKITTVFTGSADSARREKTYVDGHGRTVKTERPGFGYSYLSGTDLVSEIAVMEGAVLTKTVSYASDRDLPSEIAYAKADGSLIAKRSYEYDALSRVSSRVQTRGNGESAVSRADAFGYNARSELTSATLGSDEYSYAFDAIGNRETSSESGTSLAYTANALNQYTSYGRSDNPVASAVQTEIQNDSSSQSDAPALQNLNTENTEENSAFAPTYDADGNATLIQTSTGTWSVSWNAENRPVRFENTETQTVVECGYDSQGRRFFKKVTVAGTVTLHERYVCRGYLQIAAFDVAETDGVPTLSLSRVIFWDPAEPTATRPLAVNVIGDQVYFPTVDLTKNVCELIDFYGNVAATYDYAPFGAVTAGTPSGASVPANPFQWSSEFYDSELDLVYYNYRHYSPSLGRFLSRDPIEEQGGLNLYAFTANSPYRTFDLRGSSVKGSPNYILEEKDIHNKDILGHTDSVRSFGIKLESTYIGSHPSPWYRLPCSRCYRVTASGQAPILKISLRKLDDEDTENHEISHFTLFKDNWNAAKNIANSLEDIYCDTMLSDRGYGEKKASLAVRYGVSAVRFFEKKNELENAEYDWLCYGQYNEDKEKRADIVRLRSELSFCERNYLNAKKEFETA